MNTCGKCGDNLMSGPRFKRRSLTEQQTLRNNGIRPHAGRGLCDRCHARLKHVPDGLIDFERHNRPSEELLADWVTLRDEGYRPRDAATRLGVTFYALDKALQRAMRAGDPRGQRRAFGRTA